MHAQESETNVSLSCVSRQMEGTSKDMALDKLRLK